MKLVRVTPTNFPEVAILPRLLHYKLRAKVNLTQMGESIEWESDDDRTDPGLKSENDQPIVPQISTQDRNSSMPKMLSDTIH